MSMYYSPRHRTQLVCPLSRRVFDTLEDLWTCSCRLPPAGCPVVENPPDWRDSYDIYNDKDSRTCGLNISDDSDAEGVEDTAPEVQREPVSSTGYGRTILPGVDL